MANTLDDNDMAIITDALSFIFQATVVLFTWPAAVAQLVEHLTTVADVIKLFTAVNYDFS